MAGGGWPAHGRRRPAADRSDVGFGHVIPLPPVVSKGLLHAPDPLGQGVALIDLYPERLIGPRAAGEQVAGDVRLVVLGGEVERRPPDPHRVAVPGLDTRPRVEPGTESLSVPAVDKQQPIRNVRAAGRKTGGAD